MYSTSCARTRCCSFLPFPSTPWPKSASRLSLGCVFLTSDLQRRMMEESGKMIVDSSERLGVVAQSLRELVVRLFRASVSDRTRRTNGFARSPRRRTPRWRRTRNWRRRERFWRKSASEAGEGTRRRTYSRPERRLTVPVSLRMRTIAARLLYLTTSSSPPPPLLARGLAAP